MTQPEPPLAVLALNPAGTPVVILGQDAAGQVVHVPAGLNENDRGVWLQAIMKIRAIPFPQVLSDGNRIGVLPSLERIVNDGQVRPPTSNSPTNTDRKILAALQVLPLIGRFRIRSERHALKGPIRRYKEVPHLSPESRSKLGGMTGSNDASLGVTAQIPGRKKVGSIGGFGVPRRLEQHQT